MPRDRSGAGVLAELCVPVALGGLGIIAALSGCDGEAVGEQGTTITVVRRDLDIVVEKSGNLRAARNREIRCEVMGQSRVIFLIPEGAQVVEDDLLVTLDSSDLEDRLTKQEIAYQGALAAKVQADEDYGIQESLNESSMDQARLRVELAIMDLQKYTGLAISLGGAASAGEASEAPEPSAAMRYLADLSVDEMKAALEGFDLKQLLAIPLERFQNGDAAQLWRDADSSVKLAEAELERARGKFEGSDALFAKKFIAETQLIADRIDLQRADINLKKTREQMRLLNQFTHPRNLKQYVSDVREKLKELERAASKARAELTRAEADRESKKSTFEQQEQLLARLREQVEKCVIKAPAPGLVVYARQEGHRVMSGQVLEEGVTVFERQKLIDLPDLSQLVVDVLIHESKISLVQVGQNAEIRLSTARGVPLRGKVTSVSVLPDSQSRWMSPDLRLYGVVVSVDNAQGLDLKPGMTADVSILVENLPDVLVVPIQAVTPVGSDSFVLVQAGGRVEKRKVVLGKYNDVFAEVASGLSEGERVLLQAVTMPSEGKSARRENGNDRGEGGNATFGSGGDPGAAGGNPGPVGGNPGAVGGNPGAVGGNPGAVGGNPGEGGGAPPERPRRLGGGERSGMPGGAPRRRGDT